MKSLNDERKEFVAQNHNLIYAFLHANKLSVEDWYDIAAIGLCKAALSYDTSKSRFSTYAYKCMWNEVKIEIRKQNAIRRADDNAVLHYDAMFACNEDGDECNYLSLIPDTKRDTGKQAVVRIALYELLGKLSDRERDVIHLLSMGYRQKDVANFTSYSQPQISRIQNKAKMLYEMGA